MAIEYKVLGPVVHHDIYTDSIAADVIGYFQDVLITPLESALNDRGVIPSPTETSSQIGRLLRDRADTHFRNSTHESNALKHALASGVVWYADESFHGTFNAEISAQLSKMGARFKSRSQTFSIPLASIPLDVRQSIYEARDSSAKTIAAVAALVLLMRANVDEAPTGIDIRPTEKKILDAASAEFNKALQDFDKGRNPLGIPSNMKDVADDINEAVKADAKRVAIEELEKLSEELATLAATDAPLDAVKKTIDRVKKRLVNRTRTLSEHAAALLLSEYRREQAKRLGLSSYIWRTMRDHRVRHDHRLLDGKQFRWDSPPITNQSTGERHAPGEDINCRCVPLNLIPVILKTE